MKNKYDTLEGSIDPYGLLDDKKEPYCSDCRSLEKELDVIKKESLGFEYEIEKLKKEITELKEELKKEREVVDIIIPKLRNAGNSPIGLFNLDFAAQQRQRQRKIKEL